MRKQVIIITLFAILGLVAFAGRLHNPTFGKDEVTLLYLKQRVMEFASRYRNQDVIVVSKKDHLLFYCQNGQVVKNDYWNGYLYSFPVKVSLAGRFYRTPEGEMAIDSKNLNSRYIRFLHLSIPGAYGIHSGPTHLAGYYENLEKLDPNIEVVTQKDDTRGCVAVENRVIKYLFAKVDVQTPVLIMP